MKNNQVYLDPQNLEQSIQQLNRFYRLDDVTLRMMRRVVERFPKPVILYVDEANAPLFAQSPLDDQFTFNTQTGELVLFSSDPMTFIDAIIEMWMFISGFETLMGVDDYWKVELAIGAWKPVKDNLKRELGIPVHHQIMAVVGLPPEPDEAPLEDPFPFRTLVSKLTVVSYANMVKLAGRPQVRVNFPPGTDFRVTEVYFSVRRAIRKIGRGLSIQDAEIFNQRLQEEIERLENRYQPNTLPVPAGWQSMESDHSAASGEMNSDKEKDDADKAIGLLLGPSDEEPEIGKLPTFRRKRREEEDNVDNVKAIDDKLAQGPFGQFIETLFED